MTINTVNRMARSMDYPSASEPVSLLTAIAAPGTAWQNSNYGDSEVGSVRKMNGLGDVISDITTGNFAALPGDIVTGLSTGDVGSYLIVGGLAFLLLGGGLLGKSGSRERSRKARLTGQIAKDKALL